MSLLTETVIDSHRAKHNLKKHIVIRETYINEPHRNLRCTKFQINCCLKLLAKLRALRKLS